MPELVFVSGTEITWGSLMMPNPIRAEIAVHSGTGAGIECRNHYVHMMVVSSEISSHFTVYCNVI